MTAWIRRLLGSVFHWPRAAPVETGFDRSVRVYVTLGIVVISVLSLSAVPMLLYEKSSCPVQEIAEPVGELLNEIQTLASHESEVASGFAVTGAREQTATSYWLRERRQRAVKELIAIDVLGPRFQAESRHLATHLVALDARVDDLYAGRLAPTEYAQRFAAEGTTSGMVADSAQVLRDIIAARVAMHRAATHTAEKRAGALSLLSTILSVIAVIAVARLGGRYRRAADREHAERARSDEAYAEAERRRLEVERVSASRDVLVRGFSHNLGNPLVAADWHLRLLEGAESGSLTPVQAQAVSSARQSVTTATKMVTGLLELARAEGGQIPIRPAPVDVGAVAGQVVQEYSAAAQAKGLALRNECGEGVPLVESDVQHVRQIVTNLLSNALNYTATGEVGVRVIAVGGDGREPARSVRVEVWDTGSGLDENQQKNVFKEFYRGDLPGATPGSGIGLAISSRLAAALGGTLQVRSELGRGSTFILELPVECEATADSVRLPDTQA